MTASRLQGLAVLVLEDDFYLADDTRQALEGAGARVLGPFADAASGLRALEHEIADCAVVDVNLGHGPSFEPARALLARGIPMVLVTGYDASAVPAELGDLLCLQKPTDAGKVVAAVSALCAPAGKPS